MSIFDPSTSSSYQFFYSGSIWGGSVTVMEVDGQTGDTIFVEYTTSERLIVIPDKPIVQTPLPGAFGFFLTGITLLVMFLRKTSFNNRLIS
jgi:hypothetical protein